MKAKPLAAVIMAAGQGKRMQDPSKPKVLYPLADRPLLAHVLDLCRKINCERIIAIIGHAREQVEAFLKSEFPEAETAIQSEQLGTGHAVMQTESALRNFDGDVLVLSGDVPLLTEATVKSLLEKHRGSGAKATVLSVKMPNPFGYGRIVRTEDGQNLSRIVEEKDATDEIRSISEINSGIYLFDCKALFPALKSITPNNVQGEYYLTDVFEKIIEVHGSNATAVQMTNDPVEVSGVNTKEQLLNLEEAFLRRQIPA